MTPLTPEEAREALDRLASWGIVRSYQHVTTPHPLVGDVYVVGVDDPEGDERVLVLSPHGLRGFLEGVCATIPTACTDAGILAEVTS